MRFRATGTMQAFVASEFEDDGVTSIGQQAYDALKQGATKKFGEYPFEIVDFEFDRKTEEEKKG